MKFVPCLAVLLLFAAAPAVAGVYDYQKRHDDILGDVENATYLLGIARDRASGGDHYGSCDAYSTAVSGYALAAEDMKDLADEVSSESYDIRSAFEDIYTEASELEDMADEAQSSYGDSCGSGSSDSYDDDDVYKGDPDSDLEWDDDYDGRAISVNSANDVSSVYVSRVRRLAIETL